ncbi:MAG: hypothetical protein EBU96_06620 [Actinobacteria bacterium]|nr:hypothetical protein [Actinomycetota bacterium]
MYLSALLFFGTVQAVISSCSQNPKERQWLLSFINAVCCTGAALIALILGDASIFNNPEWNINALQAYLIVDLLHNGLNQESKQSLLEFWIHHPVYIVVLEVATQGGYAPLVSRYFILEMPNIVRSLGQLEPLWRSNVGFGSLFFACRIVAPFFIAACDGWQYTAWMWVPFLLMQSVHIYWFTRWWAVYGTHLLDRALEGTGGNHTQ